MFKKPFRVKSQTSMKGSDRKKVRVEIQKSFSNLSVEDVNTIIPNKEDVSSVKIHTNTGENAFIYCVNKQPLLFELDKQKVLYPTVYLLWRYPDLMERFTTWPPVFKKLVDGADLMLPGLVLRLPLTPGSFKHVEKGQVCSVNVVGNRCPIVVGTTLLSGSDFFDSGMRGKGIHPVHLYGDELWAFGDRSKPPEVEDDPLREELYGNHEQGHEPTEPSDGTGEVERVEAADNNIYEAKADNVIEPSHKTGKLDRELATDNSVHEVNAEIVGEDSVEGEVNETEAEMTESVQGIHDENMAENWVEEHNGDKKSGLGDSNASESGCGDEDIVEGTEQLTLGSEVETPQSMSTVETDELLEFCFLCSIKASLKKTDLPLATGTFYKNHMLKYCPKGKYLDIKKSSYKKLSKFLQKQQKSGIILVKEVTKGVDAVVEIDKSHELLRGLEVPEVVVQETGASSKDSFKPPQISEMFAVTANILPLVKGFGYNKGSTLKSADLRTALVEYVKQNNLQSETNKGEVVLDPLLAEICLTRAEGDKSTLRWEEVTSRVLNKMSPVFQIEFPDRPPLVRKGKVEPITIDVVQRAANKKATIIENLDIYGIDAKEFGHRVQVKVACSATVNPSQQKNKGPQVVVQGNQVHHVAELLSDVYKIPKKYIKGTEKAPKRR